MRGVTYVLAVLLSMAMVSTSAAAPVCDLSCSLGRTHGDCSNGRQAEGTGQTAASASRDMNMAGMEMASENGEQPATEDSRVRGNPSAAPQCLHPICSQASSSGSRFSRELTVSSHLGATVQRAAEPAARIHLRHVKFEISPPEVFTADLPITTLRI